MSERAKEQIEKIMGAAYQQAFAHLEAEVRNLLRKYPKRYAEYWHAYGYGPMFFPPNNGKGIDDAEDMGTKQGERVYALCVWFYDTYGAGNEKVKP